MSSSVRFGLYVTAAVSVGHSLRDAIVRDRSFGSWHLHQSRWASNSLSIASNRELALPPEDVSQASL